MLLMRSRERVKDASVAFNFNESKISKEIPVTETLHTGLFEVLNTNIVSILRPVRIFAAPAEILALEISPNFGAFLDGNLISRDETA
ncbi:hypothetical protein Y032_0476g2149 [Ancylostoma ceylanicum]|uniref:Uncharacterized protein n=1 Tax=Ancylostoma ceylanicum TaxID=53326 RepID=A0A016WWB4_9BILA|nr:hypothetical protein Y032_0476g2149 [Ancylostoma ceylanicum]